MHFDDPAGVFRQGATGVFGHNVESGLECFDTLVLQRLQVVRNCYLVARWRILGQSSVRVGLWIEILLVLAL